MTGLPRSVPTHFIKRINMREQLVAWPARSSPLEIVVECGNYCAAGSMSKAVFLGGGIEGRPAIAAPASSNDLHIGRQDLGDPMVH